MVLGFLSASADMWGYLPHRQVQCFLFTVWEEHNPGRCPWVYFPDFSDTRDEKKDQYVWHQHEKANFEGNYRFFSVINTKILRFMVIQVTLEDSLCLYCESTDQVLYYKWNFHIIPLWLNLFEVLHLYNPIRGGSNLARLGTKA